MTKHRLVVRKEAAETLTELADDYDKSKSSMIALGLAVLKAADTANKKGTRLILVPENEKNTNPISLNPWKALKER